MLLRLYDCISFLLSGVFGTAGKENQGSYYLSALCGHFFSSSIVFHTYSLFSAPSMHSFLFPQRYLPGIVRGLAPLPTFTRIPRPCGVMNHQPYTYAIPGDADRTCPSIPPTLLQPARWVVRQKSNITPSHCVYVFLKGGNIALRTCVPFVDER
jgi:hypothetical protein